MTKEPIDLLLEVLVKTSQSFGDKNTVYPLLKANIDKLNLNLAALLRNFAKNYFAKESLIKAQPVAAAIGNFGTIIGQFPHGNIACNLEIAIACFEVIEVIFTRESFPRDWATSKLHLGNAYGQRIYGDTLENCEKAILAYQDALKIYTLEEFPIEWAETQTNLVIFYSKKIRTTKNKGDVYEDLEKLVSICNMVLNIFKQNNLLEKWAIVKDALGSAYCDITNDNLSANWELAIDIYNEILDVINQKSLPGQWANTQMNLGIAYNKSIQGYQQKNLHLAVQAFQNSLKFYTYENYPFTYSILQNNLGNAYRDQGLVASALGCYRLALEIHTPEIYPVDAKIAARNLGNTAFKSRLWKEAIEGYSIAIEAVETSRSWVKSESRRQEILKESIDIYQNMVQACINAGKIDKAFEYSERSRSKRLVDLMASNNLSQSENIPPKVQELLQQYEELQQLIDAERQQYKSENNRSETRAAWQAYNEKIASLEADKQQIADGNITLGQLMSPGWRLPNLVDVFLSCCETNLGTPALTDDILTLSTGFLCAGARSVVSSLWSVDDLATSLFSIFYYQQRQLGKNRPEALKHAQIKLRELRKADLAEISNRIDEKEKELIGHRQQYTRNSVDYSKWEHEYNIHTKINRLIKQKIQTSEPEFPFAHPRYWAAFVCHGLR